MLRLYPLCFTRSSRMAKRIGTTRPSSIFMKAMKTVLYNIWPVFGILNTYLKLSSPTQGERKNPRRGLYRSKAIRIPDIG